MRSDVDRDQSGPDQPRRDHLRGGRLAAVLDAVVAALPAQGSDSARRAPTVLDCGGGSGAFAVPLAATGADVTVVDISVDALATLSRRADEAGVAALIHPLQGDVEALSQVPGVGTYDVVVAHGILDVCDDVASAFAGIAAAVRPGGLLSVLVQNPVAGVIGRALAGEFDAALRELPALDPGAAGFGPDAVQALCVDAGFRIERRQGIGVFADLVPGSALDRAGARDALARLDAAVADRPPFADVAGRVHLLARSGAADGA